MKPQLPLALLLIAVSGCSQPASQPGATDLVVRLMGIWESGDTSSLAEFVDSVAVYDDVPNRYRFEGVQGFEAYVGHVHSWASDIAVTVSMTGGSPERAYAEWEMTGVQTRPIPGRVPVATDSSFTLRGLTVVEAVDGRIVRAVDYMDVLGFVLQLGSTVELPGGVTIGGSD